MKDTAKTKKQLLNELQQLRKRVSELESSGVEHLIQTSVPDISERPRWEDALNKSGEWFRLITETIEDVFWISTPGIERMIYVSPAYEKIWGRNRDGLYRSPRSFLEAVHLEDRGQVINGVKGHAEGMWDFEYRIIQPDGSIRWIRDRGFPIRDHTGNLYMITGIATDITERKTMEEAFQENTGLLETIFSNIHFLVAYMDSDFNFIKVNRAYAEADGRDPEFFIGKNHFGLYPHDENKEIFRRVVESGQPHFAFEKPFEYPEHPERGVTYWDWSVHPVRESDGRIGGVVLTLINVTERKRAQEKQKESEYRYRMLFEESKDAIYITTREGKFLEVNQSMLELLGFGKEELLCMSAEEIFDEPGDRRQFQKTIEREGSVTNYEVKFRRKDGEILECLLTATVRLDGKGTVLGYQGIIRDVTEIKETERRRQISSTLLSLFQSKVQRKEYLDVVVEIIAGWSGCRCVGIRVIRNDQFIPYESYVGFSHEFWQQENWLSIQEDQCACIRVVKGHPEIQDSPVMTPCGSFWCNDIEGYVAGLTEPEQSRFRGACVRSGFSSVAVVPIRYRDQMVGAIHLADAGKNQIPSSVIEFVEWLTPLIGEAIHRFNVEEELRRSEKRLRQLSSQLLIAQENERKYVARELHDSIGANLAAIKFSLESKLRNRTESHTMSGFSLEDIIDLVKKSIEETRRISMALRPSTLDDLGLVETLNWLCLNFERIYSGIRIDRQIDLGEDDIPEHLKIVIFRVSQEALNNIAKHSRAGLAKVRLASRANSIHLVIEDNGSGFDLTEALPKGELGLASMRERTELSDGSFSIESKIGTGTRITASWPAAKMKDA